MSVNAHVGPGVFVAKQTISFASAGITADNTAIIYLVDAVLLSYVPDRDINGITGFVEGKGYYLVAITEMDLSDYVVPPVSSIPLITQRLLIVFSGESNSGGQVLNTEADPSELGHQPSVKILNNTSLVFQDLQIGDPSSNNMIGHTGISPVGKHGWELQLAQRVADDNPFNQNPTYLVKTGQGGSVIAEWIAGGSYETTLETRLAAAISAITTMDGQPPFIVMFYSQGINDLGHDLSVWKAATITHFADMRAAVGQDFPIIMTQFPPNAAVFNPVIIDIANEVPYVFQVDSGGMPLQDVNHWSYTGMKQVCDLLIAKVLEFYSF